MSSTTTRDVTVAELSKYGFKEGNEYVNWSKNISEAQKGVVVPGGTYNMEVFTADSGKQYINSVAQLAVGVHNPKSAVTRKSKTSESLTGQVAMLQNAKTVNSFPSKVLTEPISNGLSKTEWKLKDERISRQGCIQVAVQVESEFEKAVELANKMLVYVNQNTPS